MLKIHELKTMPEYYDAVERGAKRAEYRLNDRGFKVGDVLMLREWTGSEYTGRRSCYRITHILEGVYGLPEGYAILSIEPSKRRVRK